MRSRLGNSSVLPTSKKTVLIFEFINVVGIDGVARVAFWCSQSRGKPRLCGKARGEWTGQAWPYGQHGRDLPSGRSGRNREAESEGSTDGCFSRETYCNAEAMPRWGIAE